MYYFDILKSLYEKKIQYLIVGGLAVNLHGVPRVTYDIDIVIQVEPTNILSLTRLLKEMGFVPRLPINPDDLANELKRLDWINNKNLKAFTFYHTKENRKVIDILLVHPLNFEHSYQNKMVKQIDDFQIYLASLDDLIIMKKESGRPKDLSDVQMLEIAKKMKAGNE